VSRALSLVRAPAWPRSAAHPPALNLREQRPRAGLLWMQHLRPLLYQRGLRARTRERRRWEVPVGASSLNTEVLCGVALLDPCRPTAGLLSVRAMQPCHLPQHSAQRALHHRDLRECVARVQRCTSALWTLGHSWARSRSASAARGAVPPRCSIAAALSSGVSVRRGWA